MRIAKLYNSNMLDFFSWKINECLTERHDSEKLQLVMSNLLFPKARIGFDRIFRLQNSVSEIRFQISSARRDSVRLFPFFVVLLWRRWVSVFVGVVDAAFVGQLFFGVSTPMKLRAAHDVHGVRHAHDALSSESILNSELKFEIIEF